MKTQRNKTKEKRIKKEQIRKAMNKRVFFTLTRCSKKLRGLSNKYCYMANMHNLIFKDSSFMNVRYQSSIITGCNFNQASLTGVDFCNCNMKKCSFKNATLRDVYFSHCNLNGANFEGAKLENVIFVCTNTDNAKNINMELNCKSYKTYPVIKLSQEDYSHLLQLSQIEPLFSPHVLHVTHKKLNNWVLQILVDFFGEKTYMALRTLFSYKNPKNFYTLYSYKKYIENILNV